MAKIVELGAEGFLSYGKIVLRLEEGLTQLLGDNGVGKTNLITLLTEALFSKNPRGYSKGELINRSGKYKSATIYVKFIGNDKSEYVAKTVRNKTTAKVTLTKDGVDVSGHTAKGTFELIQEVLGMDYELFLQYTYQSSRFPTEFLLATPKARRDYLSNLLDLEPINADIEKVSEAVRNCKAKLDVLSNELTKVNAAIKTIGDVDTDIKDIPTLECALSDAKRAWEDAVRGNTDYREAITALSMLDAAKHKYETELKRLKVPVNNCTMPTKPIWGRPDQHEMTSLHSDITQLTKEISAIDSDIKVTKLKRDKLQKPATNCYACGHELDNHKALEMFLSSVSELDQSISDLGIRKENVQSSLPSKQYAYDGMVRSQQAWLAYENDCKKYEVATAKFDAEYVAYTTNKSYLETKIAEVMEQKERISCPAKVDEDVAYAKFNQTSKELSDAKANLVKLSRVEEENSKKSSITAEIDTLNARKKYLDLLAKALKEILAKTIEGGVRSIERVTNKYLADFGSKAFLRFSIEEDKVTVGCLFDGEEVSISSLSTGQFSRVSISTLLALRELLSKGNALNFLMLDEVVGVLDSDGKEGLIEVLQKMPNLSVFLVSHEWYHPMLSRLRVRFASDGLSEIVSE